jgi:5-methylcytosine-specific restriction endonuclease McrA
MKIHEVSLKPMREPIPGPDADLERIGDEIAELSAHLDAATARLLDLIRDFDARGGWGNGFRSCAAWLTWRVGLDPSAARERVRVARALGGLPRLAQALARGELSYSKVRALTRIATPETEERLLVFGQAGTAEHVERIVRGWRWVDRAEEVRDTEKRHRGRSLDVYQDDDGMVVVRGRLEPEVDALFIQALAAARETLRPHTLSVSGNMCTKNVSAEAPAARDTWTGPGVAHVSTACVVAEGPTFEQQQADALALLSETALHHGLNPGAPAEHFQVVVHVDAAVLSDGPGQAIVEDGARVSAETAQRLACDASRVIMRHDTDGRVTEVGARTRTIPPALRRALQHRDRGCRFPGCGVRFGQGHHIQHWAHGGPTTLSNLATLCRRHHRAVHEEGFGLVRRPDGELEFSRPDGRPLPVTPVPAAITENPETSVRERNDAQGLRIHPRTAIPSWPGDRLDVGYAIDVLRPKKPE